MAPENPILEEGSSTGDDRDDTLCVMCVTGDANGNPYPCPLMQEGRAIAFEAFGDVRDANPE